MCVVTPPAARFCAVVVGVEPSRLEAGPLGQRGGGATPRTWPCLMSKGSVARSAWALLVLAAPQHVLPRTSNDSQPNIFFSAGACPVAARTARSRWARSGSKCITAPSHMIVTAHGGTGRQGGLVSGAAALWPPYRLSNTSI